jgi:hypothetical protein
VILDALNTKLLKGSLNSGIKLYVSRTQKLKESNYTSSVDTQTVEVFLRKVVILEITLESIQE